MKDVISAAAGIAGFAIESARDLVQYMVRRGQITPEEAERLIRDAEAAYDKRSPGEKTRATASKIAAERVAAANAEAATKAAALASSHSRFSSDAPRTAAPVPPAKPASHSSDKSAKPDTKSAKVSAQSGKSAKPAKAAKPIKSEKPEKPAKSASKIARKRK